MLFPCSVGRGQMHGKHTCRGQYGGDCIGIMQMLAVDGTTRWYQQRTRTTRCTNYITKQPGAYPSSRLVPEPAIVYGWASSWGYSWHSEDFRTTRRMRKGASNDWPFPVDRHDNQSENNLIDFSLTNRTFYLKNLEQLTFLSKLLKLQTPYGNLAFL